MISSSGRISKTSTIFLKHTVCAGAPGKVNKISYSLLCSLNVDRLNSNPMKIHLYKSICLIYNQLIDIYKCIKISSGFETTNIIFKSDIK